MGRIRHETVRVWVARFGPLIARRLRHRRGRPSSRWHLDEMFVKIAGRTMYLWRVVDSEGEALDMLDRACSAAQQHPEFINGIFGRELHLPHQRPWRLGLGQSRSPETFLGAAARILESVVTGLPIHAGGPRLGDARDTASRSAPAGHRSRLELGYPIGH